MNSEHTRETEKNMHKDKTSGNGPQQGKLLVHGLQLKYKHSQLYMYLGTPPICLGFLALSIVLCPSLDSDVVHTLVDCHLVIFHPSSHSVDCRVY